MVQIETIEKLLSSSAEEDVLLGLELLTSRYDEHYIRSFISGQRFHDSIFLDVYARNLNFIISYRSATIHRYSAQENERGYKVVRL